jgi:hypothetical protein
MNNIDSPKEVQHSMQDTVGNSATKSDITIFDYLILSSFDYLIDYLIL